jgi:hypothetical protein
MPAKKKGTIANFIKTKMFNWFKTFFYYKTYYKSLHKISVPRSLRLTSVNAMTSITVNSQFLPTVINKQCTYLLPLSPPSLSSQVRLDNKKAIKKSIFSVTLLELIKFVEKCGERNFRTEQIIGNLYKNFSSFEDMTFISKRLRKILASEFEFSGLTLIKQVCSNTDGAFSCCCVFLFVIIFYILN